jgi:hypothetical protein
MYAWDQAIEDLYDHICFLASFSSSYRTTLTDLTKKILQESRVMSTTNIQLTHELHVIRAHQLHYVSLLDDYAQHMKFIMETGNPMLDNPKFTSQDRKHSKETMRTECHNLLLEINRLKNGLQMQQKRLTNVMRLVSTFVFSLSPV